jgi:HD-GYP domain-containing protein (c-di-GMP phosphodiesterase class II)
MSLLEKIIEASKDLEVKEGAMKKFIPLLEELQYKHIDSFEHSARVAFLGRDIAQATNLVHPRTLFLPGLLHDVGKLLIKPEILNKKIGFNAEDMKEMVNHVEYGCRLLLGIADFSAFVAFYHHYFKRKGAYPAPEDFNKIFGNHFDSWSEGTLTLGKYCGRLISVADFYDAVTTRENDKYTPGVMRLPTSEESKKMLIENNQDQYYLIDRLYEKGVFR